MDEQDPVGDRVDLLENVRRDQDGLRLAEIADQLPHAADLVGVEPAGGLVHDQHLGVVQQGLRHRNPLAIPFRELADRFVRNRLERTLSDDGLDALVQPGRRHPSRRPEETKQAQRRHVGIKRAVFRQIAQVLGRADPIGLHVDPGDVRRAVRGRHKPGQEPHRRRLARTVGPEEGDDFSFVDGKRHVPYGQKRAKLFAKAIGLDHHGL